MAQDRLRIDPDERARFETFISGVSGRFVRLSVSGIDRQIESMLREVATFLQADRCSLMAFRGPGIASGRVIDDPGYQNNYRIADIGVTLASMLDLPLTGSTTVGVDRSGEM